MRPTASATAATTVASVNNNTAASIAGAPTNTRWSDMLVLSEETRDLVNRTTEYAKRTIYYGWIPFILLLGTHLLSRPQRGMANQRP